MSKGKGKFLTWLGTAVTKVPSLVSAASMAMTGNVTGAFREVSEILGDGMLTPEAQALSEEFLIREKEFEKEVFALEVEDRKSARDLFKSDSLIQKIFAVMFLFGYMFLTVYLLQIIVGNIEISELGRTMITMIWTGTSTKLNTIIDFLYGGSFKQEK